MRNNQPVTQREYALRPDMAIISHTNLKGQISFVNDDFLEASGFGEDEVMGQPHNILRHPDMPSEAFRDLWATIKAGKPWCGIVKNRCKNGDYYWVLANATPLWEGGQIVGYMSVRRRADPAAVAKIEEVYRLFRDKRQGKLRIRYGQVVSGAPGFFARLNLAGRMGFSLGALGLIVLAVMLYALFALKRTNDDVAALYQQGFEPVRIVGRIGIEERPASVAARRFIGDWEGDTIAGSRSRGLVATWVERK
ncbi:MAG: PAS domain-containing protein, partial [Rhodocyclaceae bacterium]|nr:PAS domain-containing protein [Rhodocyclaceae bacterium]